MVVPRWAFGYFAKLLVMMAVAGIVTVQMARGQATGQQPDATLPPPQAAPATPPAPQSPAVTPPAGNQPTGNAGSGPIAIVSLDSKDPGSAAMVTGALQVANGKATIATNGAITAGTNTTDVTLPNRGVLRVCASTTVKLASDAGVPKGDIPGLMMVIDHGAVEASFATGRNSDILLTPDFRILIGGPGSADVKVRLGQHGDTCVDNAGANAPYVLVTSVFDNGIYRVQPGQRVMFQHGSVYTVVDAEKEACGCPASPRPNTNDFPEVQSAGLAPLAAPGPTGIVPKGPTEATDTFVRKGNDPPPATDTITVTGGTPTPRIQPPPRKPKPAKIKGEKKPTFITRMGHFFRRLFGAE
ncbi:MAG TPA: hypothetical protein VGI45_03220 [Terracidiphilus sp.]|jgi:hypothetical protein